MELERFLIKEGLYDPGIFKAFFLAGGPGSGKTYVNERITPGIGLKNVNSDTSFEKALKAASLSLDMPPEEQEQRDKIRTKSKKLTAKALSLYIRGRLGLVIDSTARDYLKIETANAALTRFGYDSYCIFVNTSLDVAMARNAMRPRKVPIDIVKTNHAEVQQNIGKLQRLFGMKNFIVIDNNKANDKILEKTYKMVKKLVKQPVSSRYAKMWMKKELEKKQAAFDEARNYAQEYERYHKNPEQIARRSSRNKARRVMGDKVVKGLDVGHKDNNPMNNDPDNLRNEDPGVNRREPRLREKDILKTKIKKENKMSDEDFYDPITEACWTGFKQVGMKMKNGKSVPNCVPIKDAKIKESFRAFSENNRDTEIEGKRLMKKFNELLRSKVGRKQPVVFAFGRLNPPTIGHEKLIERIITIAKRVKGLPVLYVSASQDKTKNPLTAKQKVDYLKKVYPRGIDIRTATGKERTFMEILKNRFDKKYTDVYMIAGSDRIAEFKKLIKKYNGTDYNFDTVNVVSAGERDADATGAKGMSASKMRGFASVNDFTSFKQGLISGTKEKDAMKLFKDLKKGMGVNEDMASEDENLRTIRENYHNNDLFNMGDIVENTKNGNVGKVIKRGPNYIQYEMEDGGVEKAWLDEVVPGNNIDEQIQVDEVDKKKLVLQKNADQLKSFSSFEDEINEKKIAQDPDVKKSPGTQPKKYYKGLDKDDKKSRDRSFKRFGNKDHDDPKAYPKTGKHAGDKGAKTKPSSFTKKFDKMYGEEEVKEIADIKSWAESQETIDHWRDHYGADYRVHLDKTVSEMIDDVVSENTGVRNKAKKTGMPYGILMKVYNRGMAAWRGGHRPGASQQQWAMARVNSFVTKSSGTWGKADSDLAAKVRGSK